MAGITNLKSHTIIIGLLHKVVYIKGRLSFNPFLKVFQSSVPTTCFTPHSDTNNTTPRLDKKLTAQRGASWVLHTSLSIAKGL